MTVLYSGTCFPLQLLGEDTQGKQDQWEEGRRKEDFVYLVQMKCHFLSLCFQSRLKCSRFLDVFHRNLAVCYKSNAFLMKHLQLLLCICLCLVGWKEVEGRTELLLSGEGVCAKGLNQGSGCPLADDTLSYWYFRRQRAVNCRGV